MKLNIEKLPKFWQNHIANLNRKIEELRDEVATMVNSTTKRRMERPNGFFIETDDRTYLALPANRVGVKMEDGSEFEFVLYPKYGERKEHIAVFVTRGGGLAIKPMSGNVANLEACR